ncbi:MAG: dihydroorotase [candidate division WOR-3 bacterium]
MTIERCESDRLLLAGGTVVDPWQQTQRRSDVLIEGGLVVRLGTGLRARGADVFDCTGRYLAPGFVDMHCHLREPGREDEETIETGTGAALAGGFTRVCPMPNTEPATDNAAQVEFLLRRAALAGYARVHPIGACTRARAGKELADIGEMVRAGAVAFSDDGSSIANPMVMRRALEYCKAFDKPVISHCEVSELVEGLANEGRMSTKLGLASSPDTAEAAQAARDILLAELTGSRLHIAHVSAAVTVDIIRWAKARGVMVTAETCPHYFALTDEALATFDTNFRVNPPLRTEHDRQAVIAGLADGTIDAIATDHAPHTPAEKETEWDSAPPGIIGLETAFSLGYELLVLSGAMSLAGLLHRLTVAPAQILELPVGPIEPGRPAELVIFDLDARWVCVADQLRSRSRNTPFFGRTMTGRVVAAVVGRTRFSF